MLSNVERRKIESLSSDFIQPVFCSRNCSFYNGRTCEKNRIYVSEYIKDCEYSKSPVLNDYGGIMNPSWDEVLLVNESFFISLSPYRVDDIWNIRWMISIDNVGSCGRESSDNYFIVFKKAWNSIERVKKITPDHKSRIREILAERHKGNIERIFFSNNKIVQVPAPPKPIPKETEVFHFKDFHYGKIRDQIELFSFEEELV